MYYKIFWPESQYLYDLEEEQAEELGVEWGENMSAFVPEESVCELRRILNYDF